MSGRTCVPLLAILIFAPAFLDGQSGRMDSWAIPAKPVSELPTSNLRRPVTPPTAPIDFSALAGAAGIIFSGTVSAVVRQPANNGQAVATVAVTFHVENAIRGVSPGDDLTISQWIGLWLSGQRYRVGQRMLVFLYPPSKLGLTSCVAGALGRFNVDAQGRVLLSAQHLAAFRADPVLGGRSRARISDFARAVRRASGEE